MTKAFIMTTRQIGKTYQMARAIMERELAEGIENMTKLAENTALKMDRPDWLDDETHWIWELAFDLTKHLD